jgi:molybdenum cofactor cytidylyltransferase
VTAPDRVADPHADPAGSLRIAAIVLAAGRSTRFATAGRHDAFKLTAPFDGRPLIRASVEHLLAAATCAEIIVVLGHRADEVRHALEGLPVTVVSNPRYADGMGTSIAAGIAAVEPGADAALIALGDQPLTDTSIVRHIASRMAAGGATIVRPVYAGTPGNPALFGAVHFPALRELDGDHGARHLIAAAGADAVDVAFPFSPPPDYDRAADLAGG